MTNREAIYLEVERNPERYLHGNYQELAEKYNIDKTWVRNLVYQYRKGKNIKDGGTKFDWSVSEALASRKENVFVKNLEDRLKKTLLELEKSNEALDSALVIKQPTNYLSQKIQWDSRINNEGIAIVQFSDWHVGKKIEKNTTNGLNEYNPDIAKKRSEAVTRNMLKLVKKERQDLKINNLIINLGGDAIENFLHEHNQQQNYFSPLEEVRYAKLLIGNSLKTIAENGDFKKIILLCNRGNHPRMTKRMSSDVDYKMNLEAMMYQMLMDDFSDSTFEWQVPQSDIGYYQAGDKMFRYWHSHQVGFQGGVGGLTIPMNKKVMYYDKSIKANWNLCSHWHTFSMPTKNVSVNGSLCGWDSYAQSCGFEFEPPIQAFQLLDKKRGFTGRFPIHCE
jgi:transposase-like protein